MLLYKEFKDGYECHYNSCHEGMISYDDVLFCAPIECSAALGMSGHEGT